MNYQIFDTLLDGVVVVDVNGLILYSNLAAANIIEYPERRMIGKLKFKDCFKISDSPSWYNSFNSVEASEPYLEVIIATKNGQQKVVQVSVQPQDTENLKLERWIIYLKNLTLEARLQEKYIKEALGKTKAEETARKDPLTGVYNRRGLMEKYKEMCARVENSNAVFSLMVFDIDDFKKINDKYGHYAGDLVLKNITEIIGERLLRESDVLGRFGGEEFAILLNRCSHENAKSVAERIRAVIEGAEVCFEGQTIKVTISIGVGEYKGKVLKGESFFKKVDEASYESKRNGKNCVTLFEEPEE